MQLLKACFDFVFWSSPTVPTNGSGRSVSELPEEETAAIIVGCWSYVVCQDDIDYYKRLTLKNDGINLYLQAENIRSGLSIRQLV